MALPSSGAISISQVAGEFGGNTPHSLSEYYGAANGVPTSGTISLSNFYGTSASSGMIPTAINFDGTTRASSGLLANVRSTHAEATNMGEWVVLAYSNSDSTGGVIISKDGTNWEQIDPSSTLKTSEMQINTNMAADGTSTGMMWCPESDVNCTVHYVTPTGTNGKPVLNTYSNMGPTINNDVAYDEVNNRWMISRGNAGFYWTSNPASGWNTVNRSDGGGSAGGRGYPCSGRPHGQGMMIATAAGRGGSTFKSVSYSGAMGNGVSNTNAGDNSVLCTSADSSLSTLSSSHETSNVGADPVFNNITPDNHLCIGITRIGDFWAMHCLIGPDWTTATFFYCKGRVTSKSSWTKQSSSFNQRIDSYNSIPIVKMGDELWLIKTSSSSAPVIYTSPFINS